MRHSEVIWKESELIYLSSYKQLSFLNKKGNHFLIYMWLYSDLLECYEKRLKRFFTKNESFFNQATKTLCEEYKICLTLSNINWFKIWKTQLLFSSFRWIVQHKRHCSINIWSMLCLKRLPNLWRNNANLWPQKLKSMFKYFKIFKICQRTSARFVKIKFYPDGWHFTHIRYKRKNLHLM